MELGNRALRIMDITLLRQMGLSADQLNKAGITPDMNRDEVVRRLNAANVGPPSAPSKPKEDSVQMPTAVEDSVQKPTAVEDEPAGDGILSQLAGISGRTRMSPTPFGMIPLPESVAGEYGIRVPKYGELSEGFKKLPAQALEATTGALRSAYGFFQKPEEREQMVKEGFQTFETLGKGASDIITGGKVSPVGFDTYRVRPPTSTEGSESKEAEFVRSIPKAILGQVQKTVLDPGGQFAKDPLGTLGIARLALGAADPVGIGFRVGGQLFKKLGTKFTEGLPARLGNQSGTGEESLRIAQQIGREEGFAPGAPGFTRIAGEDQPRTKIFQESQSKIPMTETMQRFADAGAEVRKFKSDRFDADVKRVLNDNPGREMDLDKVREDMQEVLRQNKLTTTRDKNGQLVLQAQPDSKYTGAEDQLAPVLKILQNADQWQNNSIEGLWELRKNVDVLRRTNENFSMSKDVNDIAEAVRGSINNQLHAIGDFRKLDNDYSAAMNFVGQMEKSLGIKRAKGSDAAGARIDEVELPAIEPAQYTKLGNILNDRTSKNNQLGQSIIDEMDKILEKQTGIKGSLKAELAGQRLSTEAPLGIAGKTRSQKGPLTAGATAALTTQIATQNPLKAGAVGLGVYVTAMLRQLVIENPKTLGNLFRGLGATERKIKQITDFSQSVLQSAPAKVAKGGVAFGVLMDAAIDEADDDILTTVGSIRRNKPLVREYYPGQ